MPPGEVFVFGPFQLDIRSRRLLRDGEPIALGGRQFDLLHLLVSRAGQILSKDLLIEGAWRDVAVTDNSLEQAISGLRRLLTPPDRQPFIETHARRGYRFVAEVTRLEARETDDALDALLAPHRMWIEGRAALETLERDQIVHARTVFEDVLTHVPGQAPAHVGLANACAMQFEMTRSDSAPDSAALAKALHHAQEACRLDSEYGEAWATLGFVLDRTGRHPDALAALRRAAALEADNWRHHLRLSYTSWGEERLREARRTLALLPEFPIAHWLAATVYVARQALPEAKRELLAGIAAQAREGVGQRFSGVALHWLLGLIHFAEGEVEEALEEFGHELSHEAAGHLYARECCANTWYAIGALELLRGRHDEAAAAFQQAIDRLPRHPMARVGQVATKGAHALPPSLSVPDADSMHAGSFVVEAAFARAAYLILSSGASARADAAHLVDQALANAIPGSAGWLLPIEPLLRVWTDADVWAPALGRIRNRSA